MFTTDPGEAHGRNIIGDRKITLTTDERLRELNFGPWEGVDIRSIKDAASQPFTNPGSYIPPDGAESFAQLYQRSGEFVDQVLLPLEGTYETVLVVAHGGVNRSILNPVLNIPVDDFWRVHMGNCATAILDCTDGKAVLWNIRIDKALIRRADCCEESPI